MWWFWHSLSSPLNNYQTTNTGAYKLRKTLSTFSSCACDLCHGDEIKYGDIQKAWLQKTSRVSQITHTNDHEYEHNSAKRVQRSRISILLFLLFLRNPFIITVGQWCPRRPINNKQKKAFIMSYYIYNLFFFFLLIRDKKEYHVYTLLLRQFIVGSHVFCALWSSRRQIRYLCNSKWKHKCLLFPLKAVESPWYN